MADEDLISVGNNRFRNARFTDDSINEHFCYSFGCEWMFQSNEVKVLAESINYYHDYIHSSCFGQLLNEIHGSFFKDFLRNWNGL